MLFQDQVTPIHFDYSPYRSLGTDRSSSVLNLSDLNCHLLITSILSLTDSGYSRWLAIFSQYENTPRASLNHASQFFDSVKGLAMPIQNPASHILWFIRIPKTASFSSWLTILDEVINYLVCGCAFEPQCHYRTNN